MGTENNKKEKEKIKNTSLCKKRNHISRALLETKFSCTEVEAVWLFYRCSCQKLSMAEFIECCSLKSMGLTKQWKSQLLAIAKHLAEHSYSQVPAMPRNNVESKLYCRYNIFRLSVSAAKYHRQVSSVFN